MKRITIEEAKALGFTVDNRCYPPLAYKGSRSPLTDTEECYTSLEADLIKVLKLAHSFLDSLPKGWLGKTTGDVSLLNDFYIESAKLKIGGNK